MYELGIGQSTSVAQLMKKAGFENIKVLKDLANIDRVIFGTLQK